MTKLSRLLPLLLAFTLLLSPGCAALSESMEEYRNSYHGLIVNIYESGAGPYGAIGVSSLKMDGREKMDSINTKIGAEVYNPTPRPFRPGYFTSTEIRNFDFPHTIEVTWIIYEEQQLYHTVITMPSYRELKKIMGIENLSVIGLGIFYDMPPQVKCFVFQTRPGQWKKRQYHLAATGIGTPISGSLERFDQRTRFLCRKGLLSEKVCAKYRTSDPDATKQ